MGALVAVLVLTSMGHVAQAATQHRANTERAQTPVSCDVAKSRVRTATIAVRTGQKQVKRAKAALRKAAQEGKPTQPAKAKLRKAQRRLGVARARLKNARHQVAVACAPTPSPATGFTAVALSASSVSLAWRNPSTRPAGITIRRSAGPIPPTATNPGTLVANLPGGATGHVDRTVSSSTAYSYSLFVRDGAGRVSKPAVVTVTTPGPTDTDAPGAVTGLDVEPTPTTVKFVWAPPTDTDLAGVEVRRAAGGVAPGAAGGLLVFTAAAATTDYTDTGLVTGQSYSYSLVPFDAAGNRGTPANVSISLPDADGATTGVVPNSDTVEPSPDLVRSMVDNGDGTLTLTVGADPSDARTAARWRVGTEQVSGAATAGQNQCDYFGFRLTGGQPGATLVRPNAATPNGVMLKNSIVATDVTGSFCKVTGPPATIDEAYKRFDKPWTIEASAVGPRYSGDVGYADKTKLPFGCTASSGATFSASADFSDIKGRAVIEWKGVGTPSVEFSVTAKPTFTLKAEVTGKLVCAPALGRGLYLPLGSTPLILELKPEATVTIDASVNATLTFKPTLTLSTTLAKNELTVPAPVLAGSAEATIDAGLYLNASLMVAGRAGIEGKIGPHLTAPLTNPFCGDLSIHAALSLKVDVLFRNWTQPLASGDFAHTEVGDCTGPPLTGQVELGPSARDQALRAELDETGRVLLHDNNCSGRTTVRSTKVTTPVGDDIYCFANDMTSDGQTVMYPQYSRKDIVPSSQPNCRDPQGYMYRWSRTANQTTWIDLAGACHYQEFTVSDNGRFLVVRLDDGDRMVLRDLETGTGTEIAPPCTRCIPRGVSSDGNRVVYDGMTQLVKGDGEVVDGGVERAVYVWERGVGSTLIAGGGAATDYVATVATSRDGTTVAFIREPSTADTTNELYVWRSGVGVQEVPVESNSGAWTVSLSADGSIAAVSSWADGLPWSALYWPASQELRTLEDLGLSPSSSRLVVSGDGSTLAFITEDKLVDEDVDYDTWRDYDADWYFAAVPEPA